MGRCGDEGDDEVEAAAAARWVGFSLDVREELNIV